MSIIQNHTLQVPVDCRLGVTSIWLAAVTLLSIDSLDGDISYIGVWAMLLGMIAATWTIALLLAHSRQIMLEVMSYEHRQQTPMLNDRPRAMFDASS